MLTDVCTWVSFQIESVVVGRSVRSVAGKWDPEQSVDDYSKTLRAVLDSFEMQLETRTVQFGKGILIVCDSAEEASSLLSLSNDREMFLEPCPLQGIVSYFEGEQKLRLMQYCLNRRQVAVGFTSGVCGYSVRVSPEHFAK